MSITPDYAERLYKAVINMRRAQKSYFAERSNEKLRISKGYESTVDKMLKDCERQLSQGSLL